MNRRRPNTQALQKQCDEFNSNTPVGGSVVVRLDSGETRETVTEAAAEVLSGHSAVVWLAGIRGSFALDRVTPKVVA